VPAVAGRGTLPYHRGNVPSAVRMRLAALALLALSSSACRDVLGIEELSPAQPGGGAGQGGAGQGGAGQGGAGQGGAAGQAGGGGAAGAGGSCAYRDEVLADAPVAYWRLGELEGSTAATEVGASSGTFVGDVTLGVPGAVCDGDTAIELHGAPSPGHVAVDDVFDFSATAAFSVELWVMPTAMSASYQGLVHKLEEVSDDGWELALPSEGPVFERQNVPLPSMQALPVGSFSHVVATFDGTTMAIYIDGQRIDTDVSSPIMNDTTIELHLGDRQNQNTFLGVIDEVAIYDTALSQLSVGQHYAAATAP
jgi:hypothetical protein